ncbi:MAG: BREX-1 system adenine-specific DNA-methyltransferase PglX, partial [Bacilli bacterium]
MDKAILKKFAIESRRDLMKKIEVKLKNYYVDEEFSKEQKNDIYVLTNEKHSLKLTDEQYKKRELLVRRINDLSLEQVTKEAAYTWFNRIIAIRYMELNDILPLTKNNSSLGIRVLSSKDNKPDPEILKFTNLSNPDLNINFKKEQYAKLTEESKFEYVLLLVCKKLGQVIPQVFDGITDYIDILIPDNLLNDTGFVNKVVKEVPEENFKQVEVIGWLYQYYNQTEKDRVISAKKVYKKTEIPYATQLFTPDWIVKYMVENSLGRYWVEHNNDFKIVENWKYFIKDNLDIKSEKINPQDISFIDPCCGSGHILVYAFEVLYQIYESVGFNKTDIPVLILKNNIYGLDIDDRAEQLSILSILLKAREYDKNIFNKEVVKNLNIMSLQEPKNIDDFSVNILPNALKEKVNYLKDTFDNAKEIGSLLLVDNNEYSDVLTYINKIITMDTTKLLKDIPSLIKQAEILSKKYDVVVTNPPYMNNSVMSPKLKEYLLLNYKDIKSDLFSAFIIRDSYFGKTEAYLGHMTPNVWMFISSYEKLREYIINNLSINSLIQIGRGSFFNEATVDLVSFVLSNNAFSKKGVYFKMFDIKGDMVIQDKHFKEILNDDSRNERFITNIDNFKNVPGNPIAYWVSDKILKNFAQGTPLSKIAYPRQGLATGDNDKFLRLWYEVSNDNLFLNCQSHKEAFESNKKWYPYNKGGRYRKWYGNNDYVVNWKYGGEELKRFDGTVLRNQKYYFGECISWSLISSSTISFRYKPVGNLFDVAGMSCFASSEIPLCYLLALNNTCLVDIFMSILAPTINYQVGNIANIPVIYNEEKCTEICKMSEKNIKISKMDWDAFETSWDFKIHPLVFSKLINSN